MTKAVPVLQLIAGGFFFGTLRIYLLRTDRPDWLFVGVIAGIAVSLTIAGGINLLRSRRTMLLILFVLPLLSGCKTTMFQQTLSDGRTIKVRDVRLFSVTAIELNAVINPTNGIAVIRLKTKNRGDAATIEAIANGVARGTAEALKP